MAETAVLVTEPRNEYGSQAARKIRRKGLLPVVLYGHKEDTVTLCVPREEFQSAVRHGSRVVDLKLAGKVEKALIKEIQWDHLGKEMLHADFSRVSADERITVTIPVEVRGTAPGIAAGGALNQPIHTLSVECLAISVPDSVRVNVSELQIGQAIHIRELVLPEGVKAMGDPEAIVVQVTAPQAEPEPGAVASESAEPEVIGRQKAAEESEE